MTNFSLMTNFRSTNAIVRVSEKLLPLTDRQLRVGVKGNGVDGEPVEVLLSKDDAHEAKAVAERLVALLKEGVYGPGDVAVLRHKNFSWNDQIVKELRNAAGDAGVDVPVAIVGADATQSLAGKFLAVFQACTDLERFCDVPTEGFEVVKSFLKSIRGHRGWSQKLGLRALEEVFMKHLASDPMAVFWRCREDVLAQFRLLEAQEDAELAEKEARSKKPASVKRKRDALRSGPSLKEANFELVLKSAAMAVKSIRQRVLQIEAGKSRLDPVDLTAGNVFAVDRKRPPDTCTPELEHPLGGLAWLMLRDVVAHDYTPRDASEVQKLVSAFDLPLLTDEGEDAISTVMAAVSKVAHEVFDKSTVGKLKLSTTHKFKGLEEKVVFVVGLTPPFSNPKWARRACLVNDHVYGCKNLCGEKTECCPAFAAGVKRLQEAEKAEKHRLYYVAGSRAKERLFLSGIPSQSGGVLTPLAQMTNSGGSGWVHVS